MMTLKTLLTAGLTPVVSHTCLAETFFPQNLLDHRWWLVPTDTTQVLIICRTHTSCLLWEVPLRETLAVLRQHPNLYQLASQQALPNHYFGDLLLFNFLSIWLLPNSALAQWF